MIEAEADPDQSDLDEILWRAWKALEPPEGCRAEIVEGTLEIQRIGRLRHGQVINRLRDALPRSRFGDEFGAYQALAVIHGRSVWIPDLVIAPLELEPYADPEDFGVTVLTEPRPEQTDWAGVHRVPYGTDVTIPEGPAKGFVIGEAITGPQRG